MKYLIDTCGWIEWLTDDKLAASYEPYFKHLTQLVIPTLIQFELYKWICREKNPQSALEVIGITEAGSVISLDTQIALHAADITKEFKLAMADAIIYATAQLNEATLITSDKHFKLLPDIKFIEKAAN